MVKDGSLKKKVYQQIFQKIIENDFPMHEFLVEGRLAEMFGVSRAPVREALVELCKEGIHRSIPRVGYQIVQLSREQLRDALQLWLILGSEGTRLACDRLNEESIARLKALKQEIGAPESNLEDRMEYGFRLHLTAAELSGNRLLYEKVKETHDIIRRAAVQFCANRGCPPKSRSPFHGPMVGAMIRRDKDKAVELLRQDIDTVRKLLQEI